LLLFVLIKLLVHKQEALLQQARNLNGPYGSRYPAGIKNAHQA
jgi:hypothetical protein